MQEPNIESRLTTLEQQVCDILAQLKTPPKNVAGTRDWRQSLGMFDNRPMMKQIDEEGQRVRQLDREQLTDDHS